MASITSQPDKTMEVTKEVTKESKKESKKESTKSTEEIPGMQYLLQLFNQKDKEHRGVIAYGDLEGILKGIGRESVPGEYSLESEYAFDDVLFLLSIMEDHRRIVDPRLIEFLQLLTAYRKKCEMQGNYKEASQCKMKIEDIRSKEQLRRSRYIELLYRKERSQMETVQADSFRLFCDQWDHEMQEYEKTAEDARLQLQFKHQQEEVLYLREQRGKPLLLRSSKQLLELEHTERSFVKLQQYEQAEKLRKEITQKREIEAARELEQREIRLQGRVAAMRRAQNSAMQYLLSKMEKDRRQQLQMRRQATNRFMVRSRREAQEGNKRYSENLRKMNESLQSIVLK